MNYNTKLLFLQCKKSSFFGSNNKYFVNFTFIISFSGGRTCFCNLPVLHIVKKLILTYLANALN